MSNWIAASVFLTVLASATSSAVARPIVMVFGVSYYAVDTASVSTKISSDGIWLNFDFMSPGLFQYSFSCDAPNLKTSEILDISNDWVALLKSKDVIDPFADLLGSSPWTPCGRTK